MTLNETITKLGNSIINFVGTRADKDLSNLTDTGEAKIAAVSTGVSKTGDTMTGSLTFDIPQGNAKSIIINMDNVTGNAGENLQDIDFRLKGNRVGMIRCNHSTSGDNALQMYIYDNNGNSKNGLSVQYNSSTGKLAFNYPQIIATYRTNANRSGYDIYSNGYCRQFGIGYTPEDGANTISLYKKLASNNGRIIFTQMIWDTPINATNSGPTIGVYDAGYENTGSFKVWGNSSFNSSGTKIWFFWQVYGPLASSEY